LGTPDEKERLLPVETKKNEKKKKIIKLRKGAIKPLL
jgi:hypothetical protein